MKPESEITKRLNNLQKNIKAIQNEQGKAVTQSYISALKWVLSNREDKFEELEKRVRTRKKS